MKGWCRAWLGALACLLCWGLGGQAMAGRANPYAPTPSDIVGDWLVESRDAVIRIERVGDEYQGHILWQLHETYGPEDGPELNGKIATDRRNPNPALRDRPLTGLRLLTGLSFDPEKEKWEHGHVYNSDDGRTYNCWVRLRGLNRLQLHGYIGISLFGGSTVWSRVTMRTPAPGELPFVMDEPDQ
ncbi:DUF2147 domain-containing protein [Dyella choica]|uniref:DUF2147 domain-containing protein n=1 Tax=Dyella choica TaxID=1927959 RepID=A0A3S0WVF9_9GAMM|nr:DUF2147 domain-containing protein [Dyella choica]RUL74845.1 DUF2147 domain-containing protein [Dyella choica]